MFNDTLLLLEDKYDCDYVLSLTLHCHFMPSVDRAALAVDAGNELILISVEFLSWLLNFQG